MKYLVVFSILFLTSNIHAKTYPRDTYIVVSDVKSDKVPKGSCKISGTIYNGAVTLSNGLVSNIDRSRSGVSNEKGEYTFMLSELDSSIFFFKEGFNEQVIWSYQFKSGHEVVIDFYAGDNFLIETVDKPVIYLYSQEEITVSVSPNFKGDLTFTYPKFENEWNVSIVNNQIMDRKDGKNYPYLFWEGELGGLDFERADESITGNLIETSEVVSYLEVSLESMGLNQTEISDFITFWGPKMSQENYVLVQFLEDSEVDKKLGALEISPKPDNLKRVYMLFKTYEEYPDVKFTSQTFESLNRDGFTVVEWGGTELKQSMHKL